MSRSFIHSLVSLFFLLLAWSTSEANSTTLEEQLRQLREDNMAIKAKVAQLEIKVQQQESLLLELQQKGTIDGDHARSHRFEIDKQLEGKTAILRTCRETRAADPSLSSGMYWIDPDGQGVGDDPIYVYCDMSSGTTSVLHDSESQINVGHCADPGCYSRTITYSASERQMTALAQLSNECHQSIIYDCFSAPFEISGIVYAWWNDINGNPQYFWSGSNSSVHTCKCGIDGNCVEPPLLCNCDSGLPTLLADSGVITEKSLLPITRLNFGRTILETSSGLHTLGRFECTGQESISGMPTSCADLWKIGHTMSGLYSVMGTEMVETVLCDFTKLPNEPGFQLLIGYADVKSLPTYFYVQKTTSFNTTDIPIPFETERLNVGKAMNVSSGIFTAPRTGNYFFSLSGVVRALPSSSFVFRVHLMLNGNHVGASITDGNANDNNETFSLVATLNLKEGDKVWLQTCCVSNAYIYDDSGHYFHFTGWLEQEIISHSLITSPFQGTILL